MDTTEKVAASIFRALGFYGLWEQAGPVTREQCLNAAQAAIAAHSETITWESTTEAYKPYLTEVQYQKLPPGYQSWYRPYRCTRCAS